LRVIAIEQLYGRDLPDGDSVKFASQLALAGLLSVSGYAQDTTQTTTVTTVRTASMPTFRVNVISRTVQAVDYQHRNGSTKVDFTGTSLMPIASGHAKVESKRGTVKVGAEFAELQSPTSFGGEYLTYVMWAISPEGRAVNLGEVLVGDNNRSKLTVTTDLQAFALIVTAEPYYAVHQPSNVVVLENVVRADTKGTTEAVNAKYELMERGGYIPTGYKFDPVVLNARLPLEFFEARNALRIAQSEGAEQYAADSYQHAVQLMNDADGFATTRRIQEKQLIAAARQTVQTAEDARTIAVKKIDEARRTDEREAAAAALAQSQAQTDDATRRKEKAQADAANAQSDTARAQADSAQSKLDLTASQAASAAALASAHAETDQANMSARQAETDKADMRTRLSEQLNLILQTHDSARGLIVDMSDVLFDTGQYTLTSGAREKLAKIAGILLAYPGIAVEVGGYTDNVGSDRMNQTLSENRAGSVRDYLVQSGVSSNSVSAKGFGNTLPVASNDAAAGRQQNRRVELVVSGDVIGSPVNVTTGSLR
jgi:outer membrane protein OmpA-like peptidoglycan-associated protein